MAKNSKSIEIILELNGKQVVATVKRVKGVFDQVEKSVAKAHKRSGGFLSSWEKATIVANQLLELMRKVGMMIQFIAKPLKEAALFEQYRTTLKNLIGDVNEADRRFREMVEFAAKTPFDVPGIIEAGNRLEALGRYSLETIEMLGDLAAASGKDVMQAVEAYTNMVTGRTGIAVKQFRAMLIATSDWTRTTGKQILTTGSGVKASIEEMIEALPKIVAEKGFTNLMAEQSKTLMGLWANLEDAVQRFLASLGDKGIQSAKKFVKGLTSGLDTLSENIETVISGIKHLIKFSVLWLLVFKGKAIFTLMIAPLIKLQAAILAAGGAMALLRANWVGILAGAGVAIWQVIDLMSVNTEKYVEVLLKQKTALSENLEKQRETLIENNKMSQTLVDMITKFRSLRDRYKDTRMQNEEYLESLRDIKTAMKDVTVEVGAVELKMGDLTDVGLELLNAKFIAAKSVVEAYSRTLGELKEQLADTYKAIARLDFKKASAEFKESAEDIMDSMGLFDLWGKETFGALVDMDKLTEKQKKAISKYFDTVNKTWIRGGKTVKETLSVFDYEQFSQDVVDVTESYVKIAVKTGEWDNAKLALRGKFQDVIGVFKDKSLWDGVTLEGVEALDDMIQVLLGKAFDRVDSEQGVYVERIVASSKILVKNIEETIKGGTAADELANQLKAIDDILLEVTGRVGSGLKDYHYELSGELAEIYGDDNKELVFNLTDPANARALVKSLTDSKKVMELTLEGLLSTQKEEIDQAEKDRKDALQKYVDDLTRINEKFAQSDQTEKDLEVRYNSVLDLQNKFLNDFVDNYTNGTKDLDLLKNDEFKFWGELLEIFKVNSEERIKIRKKAVDEEVGIMTMGMKKEKDFLDFYTNEYADFISDMKAMYGDLSMASLLKSMTPAEVEYFNTLKKNILGVKSQLQDNMFFQWSVKLSEASLKGTEEFNKMLNEFIKATSAFQQYIPSVDPEQLLDDILQTDVFDYRRAFMESVFPELSKEDMQFHWPSIAPSGAMLKDLKKHPTGWKEIFMKITDQDPDSVGVTDISQAQQYIQDTYDKAFTFEKYLTPEFVLTPKFTVEEEKAFREWMMTQPWFEDMMKETQEEYEIIFAPIVDIKKTEEAFEKLIGYTELAKDIALEKARQIVDATQSEIAQYEAEINALEHLIAVYGRMITELEESDLSKPMAGEDDAQFERRKALYEKLVNSETLSKEQLKTLQVDYDNFLVEEEKDTAERRLAATVEFFSTLKGLMQDLFRFQQEQAEAEVGLWLEKEQKKLDAEKQVAMGFARTAQQKEKIEEQYQKKQAQLEEEAEKLKQEKLESSFEMYKAASIAEAITSTYAGATRAYKDYPFPFSLAVAGIIIATGLANIAMIAQQSLGNVSGKGGVSGFDTGGYTGEGNVDEPAGIVHKKEFVIKASETRKHLPLLEKLNAGEKIEAKDLKSLAVKDAKILYKTGGLVRDLSETVVTPKGELVKEKTNEKTTERIIETDDITKRNNISDTSSVDVSNTDNFVSDTIRVLSEKEISEYKEGGIVKEEKSVSAEEIKNFETKNEQIYKAENVAERITEEYKKGGLVEDKKSSVATEKISETSLENIENIANVKNIEVEKSKEVENEKRKFIDKNSEQSNKEISIENTVTDDIFSEANIENKISESSKKSETEKVTEPDFVKGGYTGKGNPDEPAGIVHKGEYVINAEDTKNHIKILEEINNGKSVSPEEAKSVDFDPISINPKRIRPVDIKKKAADPDDMLGLIGYKDGGLVGEAVPMNLNDFISPQRIPISIEKDFDITHILGAQKIGTDRVNSDVLDAINRLNENLEYYLKNPVAPIIDERTQKKIVSKSVHKLRRESL